MLRIERVPDAKLAAAVASARSVCGTLKLLLGHYPATTKECDIVMRGLLCTRCNMGLEYFDHSAKLLVAAGRYLR